MRLHPGLRDGSPGRGRGGRGRLVDPELHLGGPGIQPLPVAVDPLGPPVLGGVGVGPVGGRFDRPPARPPGGRPGAQPDLPRQVGRGPNGRRRPRDPDEPGLANSDRRRQQLRPRDRASLHRPAAGRTFRTKGGLHRPRAGWPPRTRGGLHRPGPGLSPPEGERSRPGGTGPGVVHSPGRGRNQRDRYVLDGAGADLVAGGEGGLDGVEEGQGERRGGPGGQGAAGQ